MNRVLFVLALVPLMFVAFMGNCFAEDLSSGSTVSRAAIDKKFTFIEKQLQPRVKQKLTSVTNKFNKIVKKTVINNNGVDVYSMAKVEAKKLFCICSPEQLDALIFHMLITELEKMEIEVEELRQRFGESTSMYVSMNLKAFLLFETAAEVYRTIKRVDANTIQDIP